MNDKTITVTVRDLKNFIKLHRYISSESDIYEHCPKAWLKSYETLEQTLVNEEFNKCFATDEKGSRKYNMFREIQ